MYYSYFAVLRKYLAILYKPQYLILLTFYFFNMQVKLWPSTNKWFFPCFWRWKTVSGRSPANWTFSVKGQWMFDRRTWFIACNSFYTLVYSYYVNDSDFGFFPTTFTVYIMFFEYFFKCFITRALTQFRTTTCYLLKIYQFYLISIILIKLWSFVKYNLSTIIKLNRIGSSRSYNTLKVVFTINIFLVFNKYLY